MNIDWEKIKKEYPKSYEKFLSNNNLEEWSSCDGCGYKCFGKLNPGQHKDCQYNWNLCFCDFVEFFDENAIKIEIGSRYHLFYWSKDL